MKRMYKKKILLQKRFEPILKTHQDCLCIYISVCNVDKIGILTNTEGVYLVSPLEQIEFKKSL